MKFGNFVGGAYTSQSHDVSIDELINLFVEQVEIPSSGKNAFVLYKRPGYAVFANPGGPLITQCPAVNPVIGVPYSYQLTAIGGLAPYTFSISAGSLPTGLTLGTDGLIHGTATVIESTTPTFEVTDSSSPPKTGTLTCPMSVQHNPVSILACPTTSLVIGAFFTFTLTASGGTPPYTWAVTAGALPTGLSLNASTGVISGTPTVAGSYDWTITVTDSFGDTGTISCHNDVPPLVISSCPVGGLTQDTPYTYTMTATGGTAPYMWSVISGALPDGLTLHSSTGVIDGTPTTPGDFTETIQVTDANGITATITCSQSVTALGPEIVRPTMTVVYNPAAYGFVYNPDNAIDGDPGSFATYLLAATRPVGSYPAFFMTDIPEPSRGTPTTIEVHMLLDYNFYGNTGLPPVTDCSCFNHQDNSEGDPGLQTLLHYNSQTDIPLTDFSVTIDAAHFASDYGGLAANIWIRQMMYNTSVVDYTAPNYIQTHTYDVYIVYNY